MVSVNVAQLLMSPPGAVREFDFAEKLARVTDELNLRGPVSGHARMIRTSEGILVHADYAAPVLLECARCLDDATADVRGTLDEEFLPTTDVYTGAPVHFPQREEDDQPRIDDHHEIDLDEVLRQNILTNLPLQPLCQATCPGLCEICGKRRDASHRAHPDEPVEEVPDNAASPFARLATLLNDSDATER
jgi:uncharacterized protein